MTSDHVHDWQDTEVGCEDCGSHPGVHCSGCGEVVDVAMFDDPRPPAAPPAAYPLGKQFRDRDGRLWAVCRERPVMLRGVGSGTGTGCYYELESVVRSCGPLTEEEEGH